MKKHGIGLGAVSAMALAAAAFAQPASFTDLGNRTATQQFSQDVVLNAANDIQWFRVELPATSSADGWVDIWTLPAACPITPIDMSDTEIGIYDSAGNMRANNDDSGPGLFSQLSFGVAGNRAAPVCSGQSAGVARNAQNGQLTPGVYWVAVGRFNVTFGTTGWTVTSSYTGTQRNTRLFFDIQAPGSPIPPSISALTFSPNSGQIGTTFTASATVLPGSNPPSTNITVSLNANNVNGGTVALLDDGVFPDAAPGDNVFTGNVTVGAGAPFGAQTLTATATDGEARSGTRNQTFTVLAPPPANDECSGAISAVDGSNAYDANGSTTSTANGAVCASISADVWYAYTANCSGTTTVSTCGGSTIDTVVAIYGSCSDTTALACNDDSCGLQSSVSFNATGGTTYYIRLGRFGTSGAAHSGSFTITPAGGGGNPAVSNVASSGSCVNENDVVTITANVAAVTCPSLDPITSVSADCSAIGAGTIAMADDGVFPDAAAGDGTYTCNATVMAGGSGGSVTVTATAASSAQGSASGGAMTYNLADDAGDLPATALVMSGDGSPLASIAGFLGANCVSGNDVDMFQITICDPVNFSASVCSPGAAFDTQMFLFNAAGQGVAFMDDACGLQSALSSSFTASLPAGNFYIAIAGYNNDALDEGGQLMWANTPFNVERAPDGPGAAGTVSSWTGTGAGGAYTIALTGACSVNSAPPCDPDVNQDGNVDQDDVSYLINVVGGGENPTGIDPDFNQDGNVDQDDIAALINTVGGGGCP